MSLNNLSKLLSPRSVVVVGGSDRPGSVGQVVVSNLMVGGFAGSIHIVNPRRVTIAGALWSASIAGLASVPDLAVVITPGPAVPEVIAQLGARGVKVAVVISSGVTHANGLRAAMLTAAKPSGLRIIGPNGLGLLVPPARLNASFARGAAAPGRMALISQSGALISGIVDWASTRDIGFSGIVSVGDMAEADLGDLIDLFAADPHTDAILMYIEGVTNTAKFMSAARAAARIKPVIALKAGRTAARRLIDLRPDRRPDRAVAIPPERRSSHGLPEHQPIRRRADPILRSAGRRSIGTAARRRRNLLQVLEAEIL